VIYGIFFQQKAFMIIFVVKFFEEAAFYE